MPQVIDKATEQGLIRCSVSWEQFKSIQKGFEGSPGVRLSYYQGVVEIFMPGRDHELFKKIIAILVETYCIEKEIEFEPTGSMDQEREGEVCVQADESYCIGNFDQRPNLSIEVIFTSGSVQKLERYRALGVPEVWFWEDGLLTMHCLRAEGYDRVYRSEILEFADLEIDLLTRCVLIGETSRLEAVKIFKQGIRSNSDC
ncbi:MAG: Uma2 family endonuclease [Plectolyngbya sp. WJT66-NPBG17]|jgi:Uma2 family endonuclease|nr:Uma2 family endonuclease [Plectolyngbya sp. WJT66-NPBG17]MBW4527686.1 Uma2 family endonuclease [Phormidium tanganyikae FI6-MK23]